MNKNIYFEQIEYHDAILKSFLVYFIDKKSIKIEMDISIYLQEEDMERTPAKLIFSKINKSSMICDYKELLENSGAGNINYAQVKNNSYRFYLIDGYIEINSINKPKIIIFPIKKGN
jgi:hypothetical protein